MHWYSRVFGYALGVAAFACSTRPASTRPPRPLPVDPTIMCQPRTTGPRTKISGPPSPSARRLSAVLRGRRNELRDCYQDALWRNRSARGNVTLRIAIAPDGSPANVCAEEATLQDGEAVSCMIDVFRAVSFDPVDGSTKVVYSITYEPYAPSTSRAR